TSSAFSRSTLSISLAALAFESRWCGILPAEILEAIVKHRPAGDRGDRRVPHAYVRETHRLALQRAWTGFRALRDQSDAGIRGRTAEPLRDLTARLAGFRRRASDWLERDALFEVLSEAHVTDDWRLWGPPTGSIVEQRLWDPREGEEESATRRREQIAARHQDAVERYGFLQFIAHEQHA